MADPTPIGAVPAFHAARDPAHPFVTFGGETLSRAAFDARANRRARALAACGIGQGDRVMVLLPNGHAFLETSFALWKLGATPVPAAPATTAAELAAYIALVAPRAVIGAAAVEEGIVSIPGDLAIDGNLAADAIDPPRLPPFWRINMSGGSTGRPKVIVDRTPAAIDPMAAMLGQRIDGVMLNPGPLYHSGPFGLTHRALFAGNHVVCMDRFDAEETLRLIERHRVDWLYIVPTMMHRIWRLGDDVRARYDLSSLRTVFHMASPCPGWLKRHWIEWLGADVIWELYSAAENPGRTLIDGNEWLRHPGSVGRVQPGARLSIFDEAGQPCAPHAVGEVCFQPTSDEFTFSYIGAEPKMVNGHYSLGDMGYLDEEGYLYVVDRRTDMIVSGGINVYPAEVEAALEAHPAVACAVAVGLPDDDLGQRVHAIVELEEGAAPDEATLRAFLGSRLVRYKIPRTIEFVREPLKDGAGKVRRTALREARITPAHASA